MKHFILIHFLFFLRTSGHSQTLTYRYFEKSGLYCSEEVMLFSDSTYLYETDCENRSKINFGTYSTNNDSIILYQIKLSDLNLIGEIEFYQETDSQLNVEMKYKDGEIYPIYLRYSNYETALKWTNYEISTDSLIQNASNETSIYPSYYDSTIQNDQQRTDTIYICLTVFEEFLKERKIIQVLPEYNKLVLYINSPSILNRYFEMKSLKYLEFGKHYISIHKDLFIKSD
jgi:hypothetical protein